MVGAYQDPGDPTTASDVAFEIHRHRHSRAIKRYAKIAGLYLAINVLRGSVLSYSLMVGMGAMLTTCTIADAPAQKAEWKHVGKR